MNRHGVIIPREDGVRVVCDGPGRCAECNKDIAEADRNVLLPALTKFVAEGWSKNAALDDLVAVVFICGSIFANPEVFDGVVRPLTISLSVHEALPPELQFLGALAELSSVYELRLTPDEMARAAGWLALRYGAMR